MSKIKLTVSTDKNGSLFIEIHNTVWGFNFTSDSLLHCSFLSFLHPWIPRDERVPKIPLSHMSWKEYNYLSEYGYLRLAASKHTPVGWQSFDKKSKRYA